MNHIEPISVRDFLRNFATILKATGKKRYLIMRHGKPIGVFTPWETQKAVSKNNKKKPLSLFEELQKLQFQSGETHLSDRIDEIVYGIGRNTYPD